MRDLNDDEVWEIIEAHDEYVRQARAAAGLKPSEISFHPADEHPAVAQAVALRMALLARLRRELERIGVSRDELEIWQDPSCHPFRLRLIRPGYCRAFGEYVHELIRRLERLSDGGGIEELWSALPTSHGYWYAVNGSVRLF